ncbi:MAG: 30S ribosomal protein S3ae [Candidatus Aenigmarchaeota archaeon]|nr:30S ribosomal protein S3ae [Candidatus Aenigmarchaeota archaeon]
MALKKQWYEIVAPKMFGEPVIGETLAVEPKHLIGRVLEVNLLEVIKDYSKFYIKLNLRIDKVEGQKAFTKIIGHDTMTERIYRMVQRHGRRVDVVNDVTTKDGLKVRVKTVFVLLKRVGTSMKDATRAVAKKQVQEIVEKMTFEDLINAVIKGSLQSEIRKTCNKVYPVAGIEIRRTQLLGEKKIV